LIDAQTLIVKAMMVSFYMLKKAFKQSLMGKGKGFTDAGKRPVKKSFSASFFTNTNNHKKTHLYKQIFKLYCSGITIRRGAKLLGIDKNTFMYRMYWLSVQARKSHQDWLKSNPEFTSHVQFDELHTFEHSKYKPLSICLAVNAESGEIIDAQVSQMSYKGSNSQKAYEYYGYRVDLTGFGIDQALCNVKKILSKNSPFISCDKKTRYPFAVEKSIPYATLTPVKFIKKKPAPGVKAEFDDQNNRKLF